jgi:hypothetical protein
LDYRDLQSALLSKGETVEDRSSHHIFYVVEIDGKRYRATKVSHGARGQISDELLGAIAREMHLQTKELREFVSCTMTREDWLKLWNQRNPIGG